MLSSASSSCEKEFVIVWFDPQPEDNLHRTIRLHAIERHLHTFTDRSQCLMYLDTYASNSLCKIFFVISGSAGNQFIPDIYIRPSIAAMYICCARPELHLTWTQNYVKIRGVFIDKKELVDKLIADISTYLTSLTTVGMMPSMNDVNCHSSKLLISEHVRFMWMRFFCALMARLSSDTSLPLKNSLVAMCNTRYEHDQFEQERIDDFERTYDASKAIWWYTRDSFLYRLVNGAFRGEDTNMLFEFRSVITDLQNQIAQLHKVQYANDSKRFTVYRGQGMSEEELQKIIDNREGLMSFNTFLSTTLSSSVATDYAGDAFSRLIYERSVLFQIDVDTTIDSTQSFANIAEHSCMKNENEVLFSYGTIFRIDAVSELITGGMWIVELSLTDAYDPNLDKLFAYYRRELEERPPYAILASLMRNAAKGNDRAELYCSQLFNNPSIDMGLVYYQAGLLYENEVKELAELHYCAALRWFTKSNNQNGLVQVYATQADFYRNQQKFTRALACNRRARKAEKQIIASERLQSLPNLYDNLATIYSQMGKHSLALKFFKKAARRNRKCELPINHPDYANSYVSIGDEYASMQQYKWALKYYRKAFTIQELYLNKENINLGRSLTNIAKIQVRLSNFNEAISSYQRAISILSNSNQRDEGELIDTYRRLGRIYEEKSEFEKALGHYQIALALPAQRAISVYMDIAHACEHNDDIKSAIQACKRGLREFRKLGKDILLTDSEIDTIVFLNDTLGRLYQKQKRYRALAHFHNKLDIKHIWSPDDRDHLGTTYYRLASCHFEAGQHRSALKFYCKLLRSASHLVGGPNKMLSTLLQICIDKHYYSEALQLLHKQLSVVTEHFPQAQIYASMAFIYQRMGCSHLAHKLYRYALPILTSMTESDGEIDLSSIEHTFQPIDHSLTKINEASSKDVISVTELTEGIKYFTLTGNVE